MKRTDDILEVLKELGRTNKGITLVDSEGEKFISYRDVWNRSYYVYELLKEHSVEKGSEVIMKCEQNEFFIYTFWACAIGAFMAIPLDPSKSNFEDTLLDHILESADNPIMVSDCYDSAPNDIKVLKISDRHQDILQCEDSLDKEVTSSPDDVLYVMYSSGTTDKPHGAIITKSNVVANVYGFIKHYDIVEEDRFISWSPLTHCYGMVTFHLVPMMARAEHCLMSTKLYMNSPLSWADYIKKYHANRIATLPFALKHFNNIYENSDKNFDWDFSFVKSMFIGGEQVNYALYKEFCNIVAPYGFSVEKVYPLYGLSEATIMVTANRAGHVAKTFRILNEKLNIGDEVICEEVKEGENTDNTFLEMGDQLETMELSIRDDEYNELPANCLGNIYVKGPCITKGYYKDEESTQRVFGEGNWLCTGDVGVMYNGNLLVIGRVKELVVANGKKISCQVVESIIQGVLAETPYQQCAVSNGVSSGNENEKVIAFVKVDKDSLSEREIDDFIEIKQKICSVTFEKIGLTISEVIPVKEIPKTSSGKAFRRRLTENYNAGEYQEIMNKLNGDRESMKKHTASSTQVYSKHRIETWIINYLENNFHVKVTNLDKPIFEYGILSINIPKFILTLNEEFQVNMVAGDIFSHFTISKLTSYINTLTKKNSVEVKQEKSIEANQEKIAIVGMSCRLPGGGNTIDAFWDVMMSGENGVVEVPESRWDLEKYYDEDKTAPGKMYCRRGGFLNCDIDEFDARFFNISPKEAAALDPQQRMLLELTWEAFENANMDIEKYNGSNTGVYLGICNNEYHLSQLYSGDLDTINAYSLTGSCMSTACGRISYTFGFEGPCVAVDTACSSALTALHIACTAMQSGEADMQVIAGINLMESPSTNIGFSKLQATSVDGYSKSFDESANGYGRGEGGGVIILKRLSDAIKDNNEILGIIRGTGMNQDGKSNGLTAPNGESQEKLIRKTMIRAGVSPLDVDYVEMHGTGTKLGDPIEVGAVGATYGVGRTEDNLLKIGSVKSNIGHLESAAGIASIIKVLLAMKHNMIPANLHFHTPNPLINWDEAHVKVIDKHTKWEKEDGLRMAAVNGFGFGGSNAHVIIEEYKPEEVTSTTEQEETQDGLNYMLKISAQSEASLITLIQEYRYLIEQSDEDKLEDILYTANTGRTDLSLRFVVTGSSKRELVEKMNAFLENGFAEGVTCNVRDSKMIMKDRKIVFMFTGQGSQYVNMGKMLYETNETFRDAFEECNKLFRPYLVKSITDLVYGPKADAKVIERTVFAQPLIFAIEYALYKMWEEIGVTPDVVMGHSIGEYAAAVAAGMISLPDAVKLVATRGRLMDMCPGHGKMATVFTSEEKLQELLKGFEDTVCIAAKNADETCVISGEGEDVEKVEEKAKAMDIRVKELTVSHAFHSMLMEPILDDFYEIAKEVQYNPANVRFVSALYGKELEEGQILDADYWTKHIRAKVDFHGAVTSIEKKEEYLLLEVGSNRVLAALAKLIFGDDQVIASTLSIKKEDKEYLANEIGYVYASGVNVDWSKISFAGKKTWKPVALPNYPYDKKKYWMDLKYDRNSAEIDMDDYHPILGQRIDLTSIQDAVMFQSKFTATEPYFMREHIIYGAAISPAAAHSAMMLLAVNQISNAKSCVLSKIEFRAPLAAADEDERQVQIYIDKDSEQPNFKILSRDYGAKDNKWLLHSKGDVSMLDEYQYDDMHADIDAYKELTFEEDIEGSIYYFMTKSGFELGDGFRRIKKISYGDGDCVCMVEPLKTVPYYKDYILYPGTIDSIFQTGIALVLDALRASTNVEDGTNKTVIPYYMEKLTYNYRESDQLWCYTKSTLKNDITYADVNVYNEKGELVLRVENLMAKITDNISLLRELKNLNKMYFHTDWIATQEYSAANVKDRTCIVFADDEASMNQVAEQAKGFGTEPICVLAGDSFAKKDAKSYVINQEEKADWTKLIQDIANENGKQGYQIVYVNAKDMVPVDAGEAMNYAAVKGLLYLIQVVNEEGIVKNSKIKILTRNAQSMDAKDINLSGSMVWGLAKTASIEYAEIFGGIVDVDDAAWNENTKWMQEVFSDNTEEISICGEKRYVAKLISHTEYLKKETKLKKKITIQEDASYLITGGTGALGIVYAKQLVNAGAKNLILLSRRDPGDAAKEAIAQFTEAGVKVVNPHADVCDYESLAKALAEVQETMPPIRGVVHTAGVLNDKMMIDFDWDEFVKVLQPKVAGTMNLYQVIKENTLDFFMMLSSITSIIGNMGQANYAAANHFMNRFASFLSKNNIPGYTFCWGPWAESGMAAGKDAVSNTMDTMGMKSIEKEQGLKIIEDFLEQPFENLLIVDVDWNVLGGSLKSAAGKTAFLSKLMTETDDAQDAGSDEQTKEVLKELQELSAEERKEYIVKKLQVICGKVMGFDKDQVSPDDAFREQGADSLMIFSMRTAINKLLGTDINVSAFFNYPTITKLTNYLLEEVLQFEDKVEEATEDSNDVDDILSEIAKLTD